MHKIICELTCNTNYLIIKFIKETFFTELNIPNYVYPINITFLKSFHKMAAKLFLNYYENSKNSEFSFEYFRKEILLVSTPHKIKLTTEVDKPQCVALLRDSIVSNLGLNPFFYKFDFGYDELTKLNKILLDTQNLYINKNQFAHKGNIGDKYVWNDFFFFLETIKIIETKCKKFTDEILVVARDLILTESIVFNFRSLKIYLISCYVPGLNGFSGKNSIYINQNELTMKYNGLITSMDEVKALNILKFECLRLFVHETCHVIIRHGLKDLNLSSPKLPNIEAGIAAEEAFFKHRIDWLASAVKKKFNYEYCFNYLTNLLADNYESFDFEESNCTIDTRTMYMMAIDYKKSAIMNIII
ncbi:hypothetical protein BpHYR1_020902 [Brachionus plicatilis]|uniref:Uncharacterized protein n=1 Tax=Brachionus plicatilis TaxID=10195 RepID=A0A3M7REJ5_BRAPC|nr:hypothetical protein BpHYR1_020902 [Brachionus plicatilis]